MYIIDWILAKLPVLIFVVIFIGQIVRALMRSRKTQEEQPRHNELEEQRRTQEIQEEIRRKIAERRSGRSGGGGLTQHERPAQPAEPPVVIRREDPTALPVPEPLRRMLEQLERKAEQTRPVPAPVSPPVLAHRHAELERQERLAEEMRTLEESRALVTRRATNLAAAKAAEARSETGLRSAARGRVLDDLKDPESLRRAFVLREVLGTPVGLR